VRESVFEEAFENLDEDKDGKITKQEFINYYKRTGVAMWYVV
jgi:Ca2+-binding EF-hand superfamily protein